MPQYLMEAMMYNTLDSLDKVKQAFDDWRQQRPKRCPIPAYLWDMVKPLLDEYPKHIVSRSLGLSSSQIKNNVINPKLTFVEAVPAKVNDRHETDTTKDNQQCCDIELKRPCGSVLMINALPIPVISTLIPSFVGV